METFAPTQKRAYRYEDADNVRRLLREIDGELVYPDIIVGSFGIMDSNNKPIIINWKVSGVRTDGKHGYVGDSVAHNNHTNSLLESMFRGWK